MELGPAGDAGIGWGRVGAGRVGAGAGGMERERKTERKKERMN